MWFRRPVLSVRGEPVEPHKAMTHRGFTLLEVLVAMAILALTLTSAMRILGHGLQTATELDDRMFGQWVAENHLAQMRAFGVFPPLGEAEGHAQQADRTYHWKTVVQPTPNPLFRRVDVTVQTEAEAGLHVARLSGYAFRPLQP
jgi:general secretion pathway protein I